MHGQYVEHPPALLDRMEPPAVGLHEDEKSTSRCSTCCRTDEKPRFEAQELAISESAVRTIIRYYTREAGVRALERELSRSAQGRQGAGHRRQGAQDCGLRAQPR